MRKEGSLIQLIQDQTKTPDYKAQSSIPYLSLGLSVLKQTKNLIKDIQRTRFTQT